MKENIPMKVKPVKTWESVQLWKTEHWPIIADKVTVPEHISAATGVVVPEVSNLMVRNNAAWKKLKSDVI